MSCMSGLLFLQLYISLLTNVQILPLSFFAVFLLVVTCWKLIEMVTTGDNFSLCHQAFAWWSCSGSWRIGTAACLVFPWYPAPLTRSPVSTCTATRCWHSQPGTQDTVSTLIKIAPYLLEVSLLHLDGKDIIACFSKTDESAANSFWKEKQALISPAEYQHPEPITLTVWPKRDITNEDVYPALMFSPWLTGTSILRGCLLTTPSPCCSGCWPTLPRSLLRSGRSSTRTTNL